MDSQQACHVLGAIADAANDLGGIVGLVLSEWRSLSFSLSLSFCLSLSLSRFPNPSIGADKLNFLVARLRLELALAVEPVLWLLSKNELRPTEALGEGSGRSFAFLGFVAGSE